MTHKTPGERAAPTVAPARSVRRSTLRILMLSYEYPPWGGGTGNACQRLLEAFRRDPAIHVDLVTSGPAARSAGVEDHGELLRIHRVPIAKRDIHFWSTTELAQWTARALAVSRRLARERSFDLCHCWSGWPSGWIGYALRNRLPYLVALRGSDVPGYNPRLKLLDPLLLRHVSRHVWRRARAVTAVSEHLRTLAGRTERDLRIEVIANGVDLDRFCPHPRDEAVPRDQALSVLFVGRLIERKGVVHLLRAFGELAGNDGSSRLVIVGDGPERPRLERWSRELGIGDRVDFRGAVPQAELPAIYQRASVFVMPALQEGMSNAMLEAMASGLPIVVTATGGSEAIRGNGAIVAPGDADSIRNALAAYRDDPELLWRHGRRSRELAEGMSWELMSRAFVDLYGRILR
jgi:glycosyltransferase involved in cell wall biosynthesis